MEQATPRKFDYLLMRVTCLLSFDALASRKFDYRSGLYIPSRTSMVFFFFFFLRVYRKKHGCWVDLYKCEAARACSFGVLQSTDHLSLSLRL